MRRCISLRFADDGTSLAEFAIVSPLLFLVLIGLIEIGRYAAINIVVANAARAGAAYGAQSGMFASDDTGIESAVCNDAQNTNCPKPAQSATNALTVSGPFGSASNPQFYYCTDAASVSATPASNASVDSACTPTLSGVQRNEWVQVTVSGTFTPLFSYPGLPSQLPVSSTATMMVTQQQ